jgi:hypothetical protein
MNNIAKFFLLGEIAMMGAAIPSIFSLTITAAQAKVVENHGYNGTSGFERADCNNHQHTGSTPSDLSQKDVQFHVGTCNGNEQSQSKHTTSALLEATGGQGCSALPSPKEFHSPQH